MGEFQQYVPISNYAENIDQNDVPRYLTEEEIRYIASHMPFAKAAEPYAANIAREGIMNWISRTLKDLKMAPSAIPELIQEIIRQHHKSSIVPGTAAGIIAAEAIGATTMQMTLNTFHSSGSAKSASFGIEAMKDLIYARKTPKMEICTVHFENKNLSYDEVLGLRKYIVGSKISSFIKDIEIENVGNLRRYWWHDYYSILFDRPYPISKKAMRLHLNLDEMYRQRVTIQDIVNVIEKERPPTLIPVYGPITDAIIDLHPDPARLGAVLKEQDGIQIVCGESKDSTKKIVKKATTKLPQFTGELAELAFLQNIVKKELECTRVKGISGITQLNPEIIPVWNCVQNERKLTDHDFTNERSKAALTPLLGRAWWLDINLVVINDTGLTTENVAYLCDLCGLHLHFQNEERLVVEMPYITYKNEKGDEVFVFDGRYFRILTQEIIVDQGVYYEENKTTKTKQDKNGYVSTIDENFESSSNLRINDKLFKRIEHSVVKIEDKYYEPLNNINGYKETKPSDFVSAVLTKEKKRINEETKLKTEQVIRDAQQLPEDERKRVISKPIYTPKTSLIRASEYVYATTDGTNLKELLAFRGIDKQRTTCNNMHIIADAFGIEAARSFLIKTITETVYQTASYINPFNIMFISEFITSRGEPLGATYTGISRQAPGHLSLSTVEKAGSAFITSAVTGKKEDTKNVSAALVVGTRMRIGSGYFDVAQDIDGKTIINNDLFTAMSEEPNSDPRIGETLTSEQIGSFGGFDFEEAENDVNLIALFRQAGLVADMKEAREEVSADDLVNALNFMKIGVPIEETKKERFQEQRKPDVINSTGLVSESRLSGNNLPNLGLPEIDDSFPELEITRSSKVPKEVSKILRTNSRGRTKVPDIAKPESVRARGGIIDAANFLRAMKK